MEIETFWYLLRQPTHGTEWERNERTSFCRTIVATAKSSGLRHWNRCRWDEIWSEQFPHNVYISLKYYLMQCLYQGQATWNIIAPFCGCNISWHFSCHKLNFEFLFLKINLYKKKLMHGEIPWQLLRSRVVYVYFGYFIKTAISLIDLSLYVRVSMQDIFVKKLQFTTTDLLHLKRKLLKDINSLQKIDIEAKKFKIN